MVNCFLYNLVDGFIVYEYCLGPTHGICECGVCRCLKGFTGANCGCSTNSDGCISSDGVSIMCVWSAQPGIVIIIPGIIICSYFKVGLFYSLQYFN